MEKASTSDFKPRPNVRTADDWLHAVIHSGQVTRIAQHLALLLYHLADPSTGSTKRSVRELEQITGWSRETIADRLSELEIFMRVTLGKGRAKTEFELQCEITNHVVRMRTSSVAVAQADAKAADDPALAVDEADAKAATCKILVFPGSMLRAEMDAQLDAIADAMEASGETAATADANPDTTTASGKTTATPDATPDTNFVAGQADTNRAVVVDQADATPPSRAYVRAPSRANMESPSEIVIPKPESPSLSPLEQASRDAVGGKGEVDLVQVNCVTIKGPNFTIDLKAIDQIAMLAGMAPERARTIAEIYAREWAANNSKPNHPMAFLRKMISSDRNETQIAEVRLQKAAAGGAMPEGRPAPATEMQRQADMRQIAMDAIRKRREEKGAAK